MNKQKYSLGMKLNQKRRFKLFAFLFVLMVVLGLLVKMNLLAQIHNKLIFYPSREIYSSPGRDGIPHEEIFVNTPDREKLHGYFLPAKVQTNKTIIYLHGNADNVSSWYLAPVEIQKHVPVNALLVDYRGYGKSTGNPTIEGVIKDAESMYEFLIQRGFKPENISVYGRSIGGAIALELATRRKVKSIVVQSSFLSLRDIAKEVYFFIPKSLVEGRFWNSKELIKKINVPILVSHGSGDEIVPASHSYSLYELANEPKKLVVLQGASHNDISSFFNEEYFEALKELFL